MKILTEAEIKEITHSMCNAYLKGELHAQAGTQPPGLSSGYDADEKACYLMGMGQQKKVME